MADELADQNVPAPAAEPVPVEPVESAHKIPTPPPTSEALVPEPLAEPVTSAPEPDIGALPLEQVATTTPTLQEPSLNASISEPARGNVTPPNVAALPITSDLPLRGLAARRTRKEAALGKILMLATKGTIDNDGVEKLLRVSDSTATRYLKELVKRGALKLLGAPSRARYEMPQ